jgi:hypothetical protein
VSGQNDDRLAAYLAAHDAACLGCGYELRSITAALCPECGREIVLAELLAPRPPTPRNDLLVLTIVGLCGLLVATLLGGFAVVGFLLSGAGSLGGLVVLGALVAEVWLLVTCIRRPFRFVALPRSVQWMFAIALGGPALAALLAAFGAVCLCIVWAI